ncbi:hypothetical protein LUZ60_011862 [Juncus effusus]|nr:hypothetical protein LUZ60_011862 [Juncus effusus]
MAFSLCFRPLSPPLPHFHAPRAVRFSKLRAGARTGDAAVVWFRNDLRIDDHPGLIQAVEKHQFVVPLYVFDPSILSEYSDLTLELLLYALKELRSTLKINGSDLVLRLGNCERVISELVNEVRASHVFTEEAIEYNLREVINNVEYSFNASSFSRGNPKLVLWNAPLYDFKGLNLKDIPASYNNFLGAKLSKADPLPAPNLPPLDPELERGSLPSLEGIKQFLNKSSDASWISLKKISAKNILTKTDENSTEGINNDIIRRNNKNADSFFISENSFEVRGGTSTVLDALAAYLRYLEGVGRDDWQELHDKLRIADRGNGASFSVLFGPSIFLGTISKRRVFYEAIKYEKERNAGFISPFGYSAPTVTFSVDSICSMEWYWILALKSQMHSEGNFPIHIWRWNGHLIQFTKTGKEGPAILLLHGFGAFLTHFRDNLSGISDSGFRVYAVTLIGFGRSGKPNSGYSETLWAEFVRDFVVDVVKEPVLLVGNSLGGYIASIVAGVWPDLVRSLVLINTVGVIVPNYESIQINEEWRSSYFSKLRAELLLLFLRFNVGGILKSYYPTNKERVDAPLLNEITRASYDPGAATIIESIFNFNLSIPLNFLFESFGGRVLIIQGMRDPLVKSEIFLSMVRKYCRNITIKELNAGHCAHDEIPNEVNLIVSKWAKE